MMTNDLMLREEGVEGEFEDITSQDLADFYSTQSGDRISGYTSHQRRQRRSYMGFGLISFGAILILAGIMAFTFGEGEKVEYSNEMRNKKPVAFDPNRPIATPRRPTLSPTATPTEGATLSPKERAMNLLSKHVDEALLSDPDSLPGAAFSWLMENEQLSEYDNVQMKQRFAIACLYLATNVEDSWDIDDGWMSDKDECNWYGVGCENGYLITLNMTSNGLVGKIPNEISLLKDSLLALELSDNDIVNANEENAWMGELTRLRMLDVEDTMLAFDGIPTYISKLTDLRILDVATTLFYGELDGSIFAPLKELIYLELGDNWYNSSLPAEIAELPKLEALYAYGCGLEGDLGFAPKMESIYELWLDDNPDLIGPIPSEIGDLATLASFSVSNCDLSGQIPSEFGKLTLMQQMWLFGNWFSGTIPTELALMTDLQILGLEDNNITDTSMPQEICDLELVALGADCHGDWDLECSCCSCCEPPCPVVNLPLYDSNRRLSLL